MKTTVPRSLVEAWKDASAFLVNGRACSDFTLPSLCGENCDFAAFYCYGSSGLVLELGIDCSSLSADIKRTERGGHVISQQGIDYEITPLFSSPHSRERYSASKESKCVVCNSSDIVGGSVVIQPSKASQEVDCSNCTSSWIDIYSFSGVLNLDPCVDFGVGSPVVLCPKDSGGAIYSVSRILSDELIEITDDFGRSLEVSPSSLTPIEEGLNELKLENFKER